MWSLSFASFLSSLTTFPRLSRTSYSGSKVLRSTPIPLGGRSRTWPMLAFTTNPSPRYLLIVLALAGDSTITRAFSLDFFFAILCQLPRPKTSQAAFPPSWGGIDRGGRGPLLAIHPQQAAGTFVRPPHTVTPPKIQ